MSAFKHAVERSGVKLPRRQCVHILRHTFASHFIVSIGNDITLQKILGDASITMTKRYSHLASDHLTDAVRFKSSTNQE